MPNALKKAKSLFNGSFRNTNQRCQELIRFVRMHSPFYKELYKGLPDIINLQDLPITPHNEYWKANTLPNNQLLTGPFTDGIVFNTGGTTGNPKLSAFTKKEWETLIEANANSLLKGHMKKNDRIGNLFHAGGMYASFTFTTRSMDSCPLNLLQFPIAGQTEFSEIKRIFIDFSINVIIGNPTKIMSFAEYLALHPENFNFNQITSIFFAGETFFTDQRKRLKEIFPEVQISSLGYASNDGGIIGYADKSCDIYEHRVFNDQVVLELVHEDTLKVIEEEGQEGIIVITNLNRKLMPTIRYPTGDKGIWTEPASTEDRKFKLLGRTNEAIKIANHMFYVHDIASLLEPFMERFKICDFQMIVRTEGKKDKLTLKIAHRSKAEILSKNLVYEQLNRHFPFYYSAVLKNEVNDIEVIITSYEKLEANPRTGKLLKIIDKRSYK